MVWVFFLIVDLKNISPGRAANKRWCLVNKAKLVPGKSQIKPDNISHEEATREQFQYHCHPHLDFLIALATISLLSTSRQR